MRIGHGIDTHALVEGRRLVLGGVEIPHSHGLMGHSDADVLIHSACDALLGALGKGDLGQHFPDTDEQYRDADSRALLRHVAAMMQQAGLAIANLDATIIAQAPRLSSFIGEMRKNLASDLGCAVERVNIKATTSEELGYCGRAEGIESHAVVLLVEK